MNKPFLRPLLAAVLIGVMAGTPMAPVLAQEPSSPSQGRAAAQGGVPISLGVSKYDFSLPPRAFPNLLNPYRLQYVDPGVLTNSPRLDQLIKDGKLPLSLQDAIALALENSMDIVVQRYIPWIADVSLLKARAGGYGYGTPGSISVGSTANLPSLLYDPVITQVIGFSDATTPIANPFISGTGSASTVNTAEPLFSHAAYYNTSYTQSFVTGGLSAWRGTTRAPLRLRRTSSTRTCSLP